MTTASAILTDYSQYIAMGFSMSVILIHIMGDYEALALS